jgi:hypothetical protein
VVALNLTEDQVMVEAEDQVMVEAEDQDLVEVQGTIDQENRLPQHVLIAEMNVNYHSNQEMKDLFIVETVSKIISKK